MPLGAVTHSPALAFSLKASPPQQDMCLFLHLLLFPARKLHALSNFPTISLFCFVCNALVIAFSSSHVKASLRMGADWHKMPSLCRDLGYLTAAVSYFLLDHHSPFHLERLSSPAHCVHQTLQTPLSEF